MPAPPKPPVPPTPDSAAASARDAMARKKRPQGLQSTILTSGLGSSDMSSSKKTLLGS